ncbi:MAG: DUF3977 family protein [Candidatus Pacebacteria bacterium]|nr:DUF3977 family protein [Candidatus Paceibacterota bacterium]
MVYVYAECGIGNDTFLSTEVEEGEREYRVSRFVLPVNISGLYMRVWIGKKVYILSTNKGFDTKKKERNTFKLIFGVSGVGLPKHA